MKQDDLANNERLFFSEFLAVSQMLLPCNTGKLSRLSWRLSVNLPLLTDGLSLSPPRSRASFAYAQDDSWMVIQSTQGSRHEGQGVLRSCKLKIKGEVYG
jgi:hypothetical protein